VKAIVARHDLETTDPAAFTVAEQPIPEPGDNDLPVCVAAIGMNPVDYKAWVLFGKDGVLGWDACGIVEKTGADVAGFQVGDKVDYAGDITRPGCNSELHLVDHRIAALAPEKLSPEDAAAMPLTTITAWEGLFDRLGFIAEAGTNSGKSVMIIGGAGSVGSVAIQLARVADLLDDDTLVSTRQETLQGLTPENIQATHGKQESGTMMGKQVLLV
jgi:NADPH:quinone reductase-like Zn-dependent oxidoreductase